MDKNQLIKAYREYLSAYNPQDPKIRLKIDHSFRVADLSERIAGSTGASGSALFQLIADTGTPIDSNFAWTIGLLHDIDRFEQVLQYGTFVDADSVDHAELGADLLLHEDLRKRLGLDALTEHERNLMDVAIRNHSAYRIAEGLTAEERAYCNILRDADKVDIFRVLCDTPPEEIYDVSSEELRSAEVSPAVKQCFLDRTAVLREKRRTSIDKIVGHVCLTFELVYPVSRQIAMAQGYVNRLLSFESANAETARWFAYMREHVWD